MIENCFNANIQIVAQLSKIDIWNKHSQKTKQMYNEREDLKNILSCADFTRLYNSIKQLIELYQNITK